ncbi:Type 1 glutamine amidotransferase-like domain-containing protein [Burkholderia gladioli]|uniref:Type 1 glutamine amidotransferase-like domain-containing protein n=1 Tax=Burkholderia gladioli TaxID=28095 RepID=UPI003F792E74
MSAGASHGTIPPTRNRPEGIMPIHRRLALYSDQEAPGNEAMNARLLQLIGRERPRIGHVPAEPDPRLLHFHRQADYYRSIGAELVARVDPRDPASEAAWSSVLSCDAIHLSGGNTFSFLSWLRRGDGLSRLARYAAEGGVLIGVSAGAILMTPSIESALLCGDIRDPESTDDAGLALVDFRFWPHFDPANLMAWQRSLSSSLPNLHACPDGAGIVVDGQDIELFGRVRRYDGGQAHPARNED